MSLSSQSLALVMTT